MRMSCQQQIQPIPEELLIDLCDRLKIRNNIFVPGNHDIVRNTPYFSGFCDMNQFIAPFFMISSLKKSNNFFVFFIFLQLRRDTFERQVLAEPVIDHVSYTGSVFRKIIQYQEKGQLSL